MLVPQLRAFPFGDPHSHLVNQDPLCTQLTGRVP